MCSNNNYKMYNFNFTENPLTGVYVDANRTVVFDFTAKTITIYMGTNNSKIYPMSDVSVSESKQLLSLWKRVLVELPISNREDLFELYNLYYDYKSKCKSNKNNVSSDVNCYFSSEDSDPYKDYMEDLILNSVYNGKPIGFFIDFQNQKVRVYYDGEKKYYNFATLPKKYYVYIKPCLKDVENYLIEVPKQILIKNPALYTSRESVYLDILNKWREFGRQVESY